MRRFLAFSGVDPAALSVNKKSWNPNHLPKEVRKAQDDLVIELKQALTTQESHPDWEAGWIDDTETFTVEMEFGFRSTNSDVDSPIKRVLDALEMALVAKGYDWNDRKVYDLIVSKYIDPIPTLMVILYPLDPEEPE